MKIKLNTNKVIAESVWLQGSEIDLPKEEAQALIDAGEAVAIDAAPEKVSKPDQPASKKKKAKE